MNTFSRTMMLGFALCLCLTLQAQMESRLTYRRYVTQDGLPQMQTERLWQDSRGYIYIGTLSGFVRFDGRQFTPFLKGRRINIVGFTQVGDEVRALGFFRQWTVGYDQIESMPLDPHGHWLLNNLNAGSLPDGYLLVEDSLEQHRRLCRMSHGGMDSLLANPLLDEMTPDRKLYIDPANGTDVIVPTDRGVFLLRKGVKDAVRMTDRGDVYTLLRTEMGLLAFASDGIYKVGSDSLYRVMQADWNAVSYGLTVRKLRKGGLVVADEHSVWLCEGTRVRQVVTGINLIRDVLVDSWDRLWVATYQGLYCFFNRSFTNHSLTDDSDIVRAMALTPSGDLVMGTLNGKVLLRDDSGHVTTISNDAEGFYAPSAVAIGNSVYMAGNGDITCITTEGGNARQHWLNLPREHYGFVGEAWGKLIIGTRNSILAYDPTTALLDTLTTSILHPWCAAKDAAGHLWIGSSSGLFSIDKEHQVKKTLYGKQKLIISTMTADRQGNVFFASADSVFMVRAGQKGQEYQVEALNKQIPQLCGHEVRSLHVSPRGFLVVAAIDGLFVCRIDKSCHLSDLQFFNHQNGFTMTEPLKATMAESADGTIWLPGIEQVTSFLPSQLLSLGETDTFITPPLRWWQHWWVWLIVMVCLLLAVWRITLWYVRLRNRRTMIRLEREKLEREELIDAIRQKAQMATPKLAEDIVKMTEKHYDERITLRTASGSMVVDIKDIAYFKGDRNYSQIVTFYKKDTVLVSLGTLEKMLNPEVFVRADRSTLVNIHHIGTLMPKLHRCIFRSPTGVELETTLLAPAFKRLQALLDA